MPTYKIADPRPGVATLEFIPKAAGEVCINVAGVGVAYFNTEGLLAPYSLGDGERQRLESLGIKVVGDELALSSDWDQVRS